MPRSKKKHETNGKNGTQHVETSQQRTKRRHSQSSSDDHDNTSSESRYGYSSDRGASPHPMNYHENNVVTDITVPWLYESHSLIMLATTMILVLYFAFLHETTSKTTNIWHGIYMLVFVFLAVGCLVFPAGPFIRPHPIFWRLLFGISFLYMLCLVLLLFQTADGARDSLKLIDPTLGVPIASRDYATDCTFNFEIFIGVMDRFVIAHLIGWAAKAFIIRNRLLLWLLSIAWELIELATKYFIPNFAECWWDSILLDVLLCNGGGIEIGLWICRKLEFREAKWTGVYSINGMKGKLKRFALQFTPFEFDPINWAPLESWKQWFFVHVLVLTASMVDMNAFLLKLFLWIPTEHHINIWRTIMLGFVAIPSSTQYYKYIKDPLCKKMGSQSILMVMILVLELAIIIKAAPELPPVPTVMSFIFRPFKKKQSN